MVARISVEITFPTQSHVASSRSQGLLVFPGPIGVHAALSSPPPPPTSILQLLPSLLQPLHLSRSSSIAFATLSLMTVALRDNQNLPTLTQNEPYIYLGIHLVPSLKWKINLLTKPKNQSKLLSNSLANLKQKVKILNIVIKPRIVYTYYANPFSKLDMKRLNKILNKFSKEICKISTSMAKIDR